MNKIIITLLACIFTIGAYAQTQNIEELNNYKYVVIPIKYDFLDKDNQYLLNTTTKHLLNQEGFTTYMDVESLPSDLTFNKCLALYADVLSEGIAMFTFTTKVTVVLKDCRGNIVFHSKGESREKESRESFKGALVDAFESFRGVNYKYNGGNGFFDSERAANEKQVAQKIEATKKESILDKAIKTTYTYDNTTYTIEKIEVGFVIKEKESGKRIAVLNLTGSNSILYNSDKINGTSSFNEAGDLVVEYFDTQKGSVNQLTYKKVND